MIRTPGGEAMTDPDDSGVRCSIAGPVATITLSRPRQRNAQGPRMWAAMADLLRGFGSEVRVVVVRGSAGVFSAGLDLGLLDPSQRDREGSLIAILDQPDEVIEAQLAVYQEPFALLADSAFISIAAVEGHAIGAGFQLALACDVRIADDTARFCMKEAVFGLIPDLTGTATLVRSVGYGRALELCASARTFGAQEALSLAVIHDLVPAGELDDGLERWITALTAHGANSVRDLKQLLMGADQVSLVRQRERERAAQVGRFRALAVTLPGSA